MGEGGDAAVSGRPYVLAETTWKTVSRTHYEVALLPWGATEPHNYHLPYGADSLQTERVAVEAARRAWEGGAHVVVLPTVPFGVQTGQLDLPFALNVDPSTQLALLGDLADSLAGQGTRKLVLLNGHGGNDFRPLVRELQPRVELLICLVDWWRCVDARAHFDEPGDHAGELETSVLLHLRPELVRPLEEAGPGRARPFRLTALREGWAWTPRHWRSATEDTGVGDPRAASAGKGARFFGDVTERIAGFLVELAAADPNDLYG